MFSGAGRIAGGAAHGHYTTKMNILHHLDKINRTGGTASRWGYWRLVGASVLNYLAHRPLAARAGGGARYRSRRKLLYTVITGDYDHLNEIVAGPPNWDYLCLTDNPRLVSKSWRVRLIDGEPGLDPVRLSRYYKINSHLVDEPYDISVYIDGNLAVRGDLDVFLSRALPVGYPLAVLLHPFHHSLAQEVDLCIAAGKDEEDLLRRQYAYYTEEQGFTDPYPHVNARMIIRRPGDPSVRLLMETWFEQLRRWSRRDQVSFNFALSRVPGVRCHYIPYWLFRCCFKKMDHPAGESRRSR